MKKSTRLLILGLCLLLAFGVFTLLVMTVDVRAVGEAGSRVGFAALNQWFMGKVGYNSHLYDFTEGLGLGVLLIAALVMMDATQLFREKRIKFSRDLWCLMGLYAAVVVCYVAFELFVVNCRPVLMDGELEASYPSSHTMLAVSFMGAALIYLKKRIPCARCRRVPALLITILMVAVVAGRAASGVHWITDIFASLLLSGGLLALYAAAVEKEEK